MKKFTKVALIIASIMAGIGVVCVIASLAMGMTGERFFDMVEDGKFEFSFGNAKEVQNSKNSLEIEDQYSGIEIELSAGNLELYYEDVEWLQIEHEGGNGFEAYVKDDTLHIEDGAYQKSNDGMIIVVVPRNMKFAAVDLEIGAGEADIDGLSANTVSIEVGAGQVNVSDLDAERLDVEVGAGQLYAELTGNKSDYSYELECGIGEIIIGEDSYLGIGGNRKINNLDADRIIKAECGVGKIEIDFAELH